MRSAASGGPSRTGRASEEAEGQVGGGQQRALGRGRDAGSGALNGRPALPPRHSTPRTVGPPCPSRGARFAVSRAAAPSRARSGPSAASRASAARSAATSPGGTSRPFVPSVTTSGIPATREATTARPAAMRLQQRVGQAVHVSRAIDDGGNGHDVRRRQRPRHRRPIQGSDQAHGRARLRDAARETRRGDRPRPRWPRARPRGRAAASTSGPKPFFSTRRPRASTRSAPGGRAELARAPPCPLAEAKAAQSTP